jgi:hypothetical protein
MDDELAGERSRGARGAYNQMEDCAKHWLQMDRRSLGGAHRATVEWVDCRRRRFKEELQVKIQGEWGRWGITSGRSATCKLDLQILWLLWPRARRRRASVEAGQRSPDLEGMNKTTERMEAREDPSRGGELFYYHVPWLKWRDIKGTTEKDLGSENSGNEGGDKRGRDEAIEPLTGRQNTITTKKEKLD